MNNINTKCFDNEIILWWNLPDSYKEGDYFIVEVGNIQEFKTKTTHIELTKLNPKTEYEIKVYYFSNNINKKLYDIKCVTAESKKWIDITQGPYFVDNSGKNMQTKTIQKALDNIKKDEILFFPKGEYLTGALFVHSDTEIFLDDEAIIVGSEKATDYLPKINSRFEGIEDLCYASLINIGFLDHNKGYTTNNVIIRGKGKILGGGKNLRQNIIDIEYIAQKDYIDSLDKDITGFANEIMIPARKRGRLVNVSNAQNVFFYGLTFENGPAWNVHMIYSKDIVTANCFFKSRGISNGDGWDPDSSINCTIFGCRFNTGDDCIAIKSGKNPEGNIVNRPCENINIFDINIEYGHGIAIGSEMSGGINNVKIWHCNAENTWGGINIKTTKKRGGYVKNIDVRFVKAPCLGLNGVWYNDDGESAKKTPIFENIKYNNCIITGKALNSDKNIWEDILPVLITGTNEAYLVNNISFENIKDLTSNKKLKKEINEIEGIYWKF